ncbi:uracil-DNA glycosylase [Azoarcus sp. L1K30]|uniref:uracil-DNA glycosylase n=1 Tax=Azoarcus sp. L1K30 TaxID=2820277 RepID=UPI001B834D7F|nr:uracil-DNA glycosylase [Azoarcus sp. L1K30]MBR0565296.1 uracil-DNA glycosylase [Azoarcus sp. L1K30]
MGLGPIWRLRTSVSEAAPDLVDSRPDPAMVRTFEPETDASRRARLPEQKAVPAKRSPAPPAPARDYRPVPAEPSHTVSPRRDDRRSERIAQMDWMQLDADIRACQACSLCEKRKQAVPGTGNRNARWMLVGEGPGAEEDRLGEPFVGQAGKLLDNMLAALGLTREADVFIANAVKCRPPHNRTPEADELAACRPYLLRQIELVEPDLLIALGRPAALALLEREINIGAARGKPHSYRDIPVVVTYHPAYLLRNPQDKGKAWEDLCFARRLVPLK